MDDEDVKNYGTKARLRRTGGRTSRQWDDSSTKTLVIPHRSRSRFWTALSRHRPTEAAPYSIRSADAQPPASQRKTWAAMDWHRHIEESSELVLKRLGAGEAMAIRRTDIIARADFPERTDLLALVDEMPIDLSLSKDVVKQRLYEQQAGICNGL